jgi:hypothetical protein
MCPGFRIMAVSMSGLEIARAGIPSMPTDMVNLKLVVMLEEQPTIGTAPALPFEQGGVHTRFVQKLSLTYYTHNCLGDSSALFCV